jgi:predicted transposase/invertase (TIGR01784 family)
LVEESAYTEAELEAYQQYWDAISRERTLTRGYEEKGRAEGKAEGKVEEKIAIAKNLVCLGLERTKIAQVTGLELQKIEKLFDEH